MSRYGEVNPGVAGSRRPALIRMGSLVVALVLVAGGGVAAFATDDRRPAAPASIPLPPPSPSPVEASPAACLADGCG
ncbi:hypothetical protein [Actinophytocola sediminis]